MKFGLKEKDIHAVNSLFSQFGNINRVVIYGSRAKGNYKPGSDIDLTIEGDLTFSQQMRLENELDDLLLPYKIDLSQIHKISNPDLLEHIRRVGKVFYEKQSA
ncbi:MAG: nucleotidyltransferase domain-containing protein [Chitinophagaceae bacterium]|jgi:predicted nucleotidyltransferase|nr:MAG: nucleotidyltransferase domain-containing protein [Chitinophagaceae bacterium]